MLVLLRKVVIPPSPAGPPSDFGVNQPRSAKYIALNQSHRRGEKLPVLF